MNGPYLAVVLTKFEAPPDTTENSAAAEFAWPPDTVAKSLSASLPPEKLAGPSDDAEESSRPPPPLTTAPKPATCVGRYCSLPRCE